MKLFEPHKKVLRELVAAASARGTSTFWNLNLNDGRGIFIFGADTQDRTQIETTAAVARDLESSEYFHHAGRDMRNLTTSAFDAVERDFAPPPAPTPAQANILYNTGHIGTVNQLNVTAAAQHAASDAVAVLRGLLPTLPADVADEVEQHVADLDAEVATATPKASRVKAALLASAAAVKGYAAPLKAVVDIANSLGLDSWLSDMVGGL